MANLQNLFDNYTSSNIQSQQQISFMEYLEEVKQNPEIAQSAHSRLYNAILKHGYEEMSEDIRLKRIFGEQKVKTWNYFSSEFYGAEKPISELVRYFKAASSNGEESKQILFLVGPVGSGKSSIVESIKRVLETAEPVYHIKNDPTRGEPLMAIPHSLRPDVEKELGIKINGNVNPVIQYYIDTELKGDFTKLKIVKTSFSVAGRRGIGVVPPVDPNNQDTSILIGSEDISKLDKYPENDPRILNYCGAFNVGNRGIVEFIEIFKNEREYLHTAITATQEKMIPSPGKHPMIYFDGVIIGHSNETEWNKFKNDRSNEAILDRIVVVKIPYVLELDQEVKIYEKMLNSSKFNAHIAPNTLRVASMFSILSRLSPSAKCPNPLIKMKLYNGEEIIERGITKKLNVLELREENLEEGMTGISTRFISKCIDNAIIDAEIGQDGKPFITPMDIISSIIDKVKNEPLPSDIRERYMKFLQEDIFNEYKQIVKTEITKAFVHSYDEQANALFNNYLDHVEAYVLKHKVYDDITKAEIEPDVQFMKSIEEEIDITDTAAASFRQDVMSYMSYLRRRNQEISWKAYKPLGEAIEKHLLARVKDLTRIVITAKSRDNEDKKKYDDMIQAMVNVGYTLDSATKIIKWAALNIWRD